MNQDSITATFMCLALVTLIAAGGVMWGALTEKPVPCPEPVVIEKVLTKEVAREPVSIPVITTGYCPGPPCVSPFYADGITATGVAVKRGHCASDWSIFPPGSKFDVPGYGPCIVEDSGNLVKGRHLDLYFPTLGEAQRWGLKRLDVQLVRYGRGKE